MARTAADGGKDQPLDRALAVLTALAEAARPASITDLAALCALPVSTVHRLAAQLEERQLVKRVLGSKKLIVGAALVHLGAAAAQAALRSDRVHQILAALAAELGEPCQIGVRVESEVVYVDTARAARSVGLHFDQGRRAPVQCTSIGKVFLAEMPDADFERWLKNATLTRFTAATIISRPKLRDVVRDVRKNGWASSGEEFIPGVVGCAVPIRLADSRLLAGLGLAVPSARTPFAKLRVFVPALKAAARQIAEESGE